MLESSISSYYLPMTESQDSPPDKDLEILRSCLLGGEQEKKEFFEHFYQLVYRTAKRYLINNSELEETINDSFLKMFDSLNKFDDGHLVAPWIKRITINSAIDKYRKIMREPEVVEIDQRVLCFHTDPEIIDRLAYSEILKLVEGLPITHRTVFYLYEIEGYRHNEIADFLKISESVSRVYLSRAKTKLRELLIINFS